MIALLAYTVMAAFDLAVLYATTTLVNQGWSPWWFALAVVIIGGSNPRRMLQIYYKSKIRADDELLDRIVDKVMKKENQNAEFNSKPA